MSNHNYSQYSKKNNKPKNNYKKPKFEETVVEESITNVAAPLEPAEIKMAVESSETVAVSSINLVNETVDTVTMPSTVTGTVTNCTKLNIRANPDITADVLTILDNKSEVEIDPARSTNEWFKITTAAGVEGYCMRKFVSAKL